MTPEQELEYQRWREQNRKEWAEKDAQRRRMTREQLDASKAAREQDARRRWLEVQRLSQETVNRKELAEKAREELSQYLGHAIEQCAEAGTVLGEFVNVLVRLADLTRDAGLCGDCRAIVFQALGAARCLHESWEFVLRGLGGYKEKASKWLDAPAEGQ